MHHFHKTPDAASETGSGEAMYALAEQLYPICRSITGDGVRESLRILASLIPLEQHEVASGTQVLDWTVPDEWNIRDAYIKNAEGRRVVDFQQHNLHVLNYSEPIQGTFTLEELRPHLYTLPEQPALIPYRTSYYQRQWGFCLSHQAYEALAPGTYEVCIDSSLEPGHLTYGEVYLPGKTEQEVLFSTHICHPSLANDNLSGMCVMTYLVKALMGQAHHYSYRFLFIPGTIGAITWLAQHEARLNRIVHGLVVSLLGDEGPFTYKQSRHGNREVDFAVPEALRRCAYAHQVVSFSPYGYDERQFCSPAFNLPVGNLSRTPYGQFPEYHTSADNLDFLSSQRMEEALHLLLEVARFFEQSPLYLNTAPKGEPQLGKRGLYDAMGGASDRKQFQLAMLWILNLADGKHSLPHMAQRSGLELSVLENVAQVLIDHHLLTIH